ncbi:MAG: type II toxin-antitoxin system VapC family toxin [Thiohalomonadales bacterium]
MYIESSVISYITARPSRDIVVSARQTITVEWWEEYRSTFDTFISELVIEEIGSGDIIAAKMRLSLVEKIPVLIATENAKILAKALLVENAVPESSTEDALHISIAAVQNIDFLLTWNFRHINNANTREKISKVIAELDYTCPVLCSPEELINEK